MTLSYSERQQSLQKSSKKRDRLDKADHNHALRETSSLE